MKKHFLLFLFLFTSIFAFSQDTGIEAILKSSEIKEPYYQMTESGSKVMYLPMEYGKSDFTINQLVAIAQLKTATIAGIDLVFSDYPSKADFTALNRKRLQNLYKILPGVFKDEKIDFRKIRQTAAANKTEASYLTHGFYIYYRPLPGKDVAKTEIKKLSSIMKEGSIAKGLSSADTAVKYCWQYSFYIDTVVLAPLVEGYSRTITKISIADARKNRLIDTSENFKYLDGYDSTYYVFDINKDGCEFWDGVYNYNSIDTTVSEVFKRNKWKNAMVIADVTGSMYPYSGQLLLWLKLVMNDNQRRSFVFFNDGDAKTDEEKVIGSTGGVYQITTSKYDDVEKKIMEAMTNGGGGDAPENNIEALVAAQKLCTTCDSVIMIADNWAPVKDISLLSSITKPIKIVLCGVYSSINTDYLNIARKTKGSLHLIERDIYELTKMKEGDIIEINGKKYKIIDGEFKEVKKTVI